MHPLLDLAGHPVIGHRGASGTAPENTIPAFELALAEGADGLEFDVRLSADGEPIVLHDSTLNRTTDLQGPVLELGLRAIRAADAGYQFLDPVTGGHTWRDRAVSVPTLRSVLERFESTPLLIELKVPEATEPVRKLLMEFGAQERTLVASFLEAALAPLRSLGFHTSASKPEIRNTWLRSLAGLSAGRVADQAYSVPDRYRDLFTISTARFIRTVRAAGCPVHVWTVNSAERARTLWQRGASGMISNFPGLLVAERRRLFP
jgi:glycerophosphoryl diester phosphodiesterase